MPIILRRFMERQLREPRNQDPYRKDAKSPKHPRCSTCHSIQVRGRWLPEEAALKQLRKSSREKDGTLSAFPEETCPACRQLKDHYAMGVIELRGQRWKAHADQVFETIGNTEQIARARNDQERLLWSRTARGVTKVYVTLPELARQVGRVLQRAFKGKTKYARSTEEPYLRVVWDSDLTNAAAETAAAGNKPSKSKHWRSRGRR